MNQTEQRSRMKKAIINDIISEQRFDSYLEACRNNEAYAFEAYEANLLIFEIEFITTNPFALAWINEPMNQ